MINDDVNLKAISKNIDKLTNKEKVIFIETLLGVGGRLACFLSSIQERISIPFPADIHYMMLMAVTNIRALSHESGTYDVVDFSPNLDGYDKKLIAILKQLNEIYKDELNDQGLDK